MTVRALQGGGSANYWVGAVDARNREYAQLMRKFQVEANLHDATKRSLSDLLHERQTLQVSAPVRVLSAGRATHGKPYNMNR